MLKTLLLLNPVYVTLFWAVLLNAERRRESVVPQLFLGKFMIVAFVVYLSHLLFFSHLQIYKVVDPLYQYASLLVYPMFYIYVRLLTVDRKFSMSKHGVYLIAPTVLFICYTIAVLAYPDGNNFYQTLVTVLTRIVFVAQVVYCVVASSLLIHKYGGLAQHYYSNMEDTRVNKMQMLNVLVFILGVSSCVLGIMGRNAFMDNNYSLMIASVVFSTALFAIGWLGSRQNIINPTYETVLSSQTAVTEEAKSIAVKSDKKLAELLFSLMEEEKLYLDSGLTIRDLALKAGSNRTEVSVCINARYGQNFCTYVNGFRVNALENVMKSHSEYSYAKLAESCGFGSVDSMKRAVLLKTGLSFAQWKATFEGN